jgi:hypothetical protein
MMLIGENGGCLREAVLPAVGRQRTPINLDFQMLGSALSSNDRNIIPACNPLLALDRIA